MRAAVCLGAVAPASLTYARLQQALRDEADLLLNDRLELGLVRSDVDELVQRTEGWPAGLYLAALSIRGAEDRHAFVSRFG